jgi:hypothetical protein
MKSFEVIRAIRRDGPKANDRATRHEERLQELNELRILRQP